MPSEYTLVTGDQVVPEDKGGPRVGIGAKALASRDSDGAIGIMIERGDGGGPEAFTYTVRTKWVGPVVANVDVLLELGAMDLFLTDFVPRSYRLRIVADGGATLKVKVGSALIATEPFAPAGTGP